MNRYLLYLLFAGLAVVLQTVWLPLVIPGTYKPDLMLILVVYLGLHEEPLQGGLLVYLLGWLYDGFAGAFAGLHGFVLLSIFLAIRAVVTRVNTESTPLLLLLVMAGTVVQLVLTAFALDFFHITTNFWLLTAPQLPAQVVLNAVAALVLIRCVVWVQRKFLPRKEIPGLRKLGSHHGS